MARRHQDGSVEWSEMCSVALDQTWRLITQYPEPGVVLLVALIPHTYATVAAELGISPTGVPARDRPRCCRSGSEWPLNLGSTREQRHRAQTGGGKPVEK